MKELNFGVAILMLCVLVVAVCGYGFAFGFGAALTVVVGCALVAWCYWRLVVSRPRYEPARAFVGVYGGLEYYMEVL